MRYSQQHKQHSRRRLVARSGAHAKKHGFADSGLAALAQAAGLTTGAVYKHFSGKADLFAAVIESELAQTARTYGEIAPGDRDAAVAALRTYLSLAHVHHPEAGCPLPSLLPEVARADGSVQCAYQTGLLEMVDSITALTLDRAQAWSLIAQTVGAVMLARALPEESAQTELLQAVFESTVASISEQSGGVERANA